MMDFPDCDAVDASWLTRVLRAAGYDGTVSGFNASQIGTGQIGKCVRYQLSYSDGSGPDSVIGKFPSDDETSRATGVMLKNYLKEVSFYQQLQPRLSIRTPKCYFAEIEGEGPRFLVLMEDLAPASQGDQLAGCDARVAATAVSELVGLHAPSWCDRSLCDLEWLYASATGGDEEGGTLELYRAQLPGFLDRYGHALAPDEARIIADLGAADNGPLADTLPDVFSLVHVDYRLDNLLIGDSDGQCTATVVDWQSITLGAPLNDVAYFLGAGMLAPERRAAEEAIVKDYHAGLSRSGVSGFDWADCWQAYRRGVFAGFSVAVIASMLVQRTERGDQMFIAMATRHARHALDLGGGEFLS